MIQAKVHELTAPLSTGQLWILPYPYGNSIGNLILHLTGNLNNYIGTQIAGTGYIRHRDLEFSDSGKPKDELLRNFDRAIETVVSTLAKQSDDDWAAPYSAELESEAKNRFNAFFALRRPRLPSRRPNHLLAKGIGSANQGHKRVNDGSYAWPLAVISVR